MDKNIVKEIIRRWEILLVNARPRDISTGMSGSQRNFNISLCLIGYPYKDPPQWMDDHYRQPCMTSDEYLSNVYDALLETLFDLAYDKITLMDQKIQEDIDAVKNNPLEFIENHKIKKAQKKAEQMRQWDEWMKDFQEDPKLTREELEERIKHHTLTIKNLYELKVPSEIIEHKQQILGQLITDLKEGNWAVTDAEIKYAKEWWMRADAFDEKN